MALAQPADIVKDGDATGFDAPVIAIDPLVDAHRRVGEAAGFLLARERFGVVAQRALIAFERQNVIALFIDDLARDIALAVHGFDGDDGTLDGQHVEQGGNGEDLVGLFAHLGRRQHEALARGEG